VEERWCKLKGDPDKKKKARKGKKGKSTKASIVGVGLDNKDGHIRITQGPNFQLIGGSEETHEVMQETAVKFNEELSKRGKQLDDIGKNEFLDIMNKVT